MPDQNQTATVIQCHKCQKRLKYSGKKPYVTCPGCGESVLVPDNIREGQDIQEVIDSPPVQTPAKATINLTEIASLVGDTRPTSTQPYSRMCNRTVIAGIASCILTVVFFFFMVLGTENDRDGFRQQGSLVSSMITLLGMSGVQIAVMMRQSAYNQTEYRAVMKCVGVAQILVGLSSLPLLVCGICAMFLLPPKVPR